MAVFICSHMFENTRPVLYVSKEGGDWQFLCGQTDHGEENPHVVGIGHLIDRDPFAILPDISLLLHLCRTHSTDNILYGCDTRSDGPSCLKNRYISRENCVDY